MNDTADIASLGPREWFAGAAPAAQGVASSPPAAPVTRVFNISDLLALLYRGRKIIQATVAVTTLGALAYGVLAAKKYTAEAQLVIDSRGYRVLPNDVTQLNASSVSLMHDFETELQVVSSSSVLSRVVEKEKLASNSHFIKREGYTTRLKALLFGAAVPVESRDATAMKVLSRMVSVQRSDKSFVAGIRVTTGDPQLSARLAQAIANTYIDVQNRNRQALTHRLATEVGGRLQDLRERVEAAEKRLTAYKRANNLVSVNGALVSDQDLSELNRQLNDARARTASAKAQLDEVRKIPRNIGGRSSAQGIINSPTIVQLNVRYADARRQLAETRRNLGPRHPEILAAQARVGEMSQAIAAELQRQRQAIEIGFEQARANERALEQRISALKKDSTDNSEALIGARELQRAVEANRKVYEEFLVRARELTEQQSIAPSSSRVITEALAPAGPSNTPLPFLLIGGFLLGLPIGIGLAFLRDTIDGSKTAPIAPALQPELNPLTPSSLAVGFRAALDRNQIASFIENHRLRRLQQPPESLLDAAARLLGAINSQDSAIVLVAGDGDERSSLCAAALAGAISYQGYDVLLADGDAGANGLSRLLELEQHPGLLDRFHRDVEQLVLWNKSGLPHLLGARAGSSRSSPEGAQRYLAQRLNDLQECAEYIIVDVGELDSNAFASVFLARADAVLIATADEFRIEALVQKLQLTGHKAAGVICIDEPAQPGLGNGSGPAHRRGRFSDPADPAVVGSHTDGHKNRNAKRWNLGGKRIVR